MRGLVAALALGLVGPSDEGMPVTEMRLSYRGLIVGEWEARHADDSVVTWEFSRAGRGTVTVRDGDGEGMTDCFTYRVDGRRLTVDS
jgi:hypothetical protein